MIYLNKLRQELAELIKTNIRFREAELKQWHGIYPAVVDGKITGLLYDNSSVIDFNGTQVSQNTEYKIVNDEFAIVTKFN